MTEFFKNMAIALGIIVGALTIGMGMGAVIFFIASTIHPIIAILFCIPVLAALIGALVTWG